MTGPPTPTGERPVPLHYEIRLAGRLDERWTDWFGGPTIRHETDGTTVMTVAVADQAALHGALHRVRDAGMSLISIIRSDAGAAAGATDNIPERKSR